MSTLFDVSVFESLKLKKGSFVGYPSGDTNFVVLVPSPRRIAFTTCSQTTDFETYLRLYSDCPGLHPAHNLTVQDPDFYCSHLTFDVRKAGTYW